MRWLILVLGLAACGSDAGTILTVAAPGGPASAKRIEIVLGRAADDAITAVDRQRVRPGDLAVEPVRYYRQRATAGVVEGVGTVDGFAIRIQQDDGVADDDSFIPFLLAYDASGGLVGAGAVIDDQGAPSSIAIETGQLTSYVVTMTPLVAADPMKGLAAGQAVDVACATNSATWRSGVAWQPGGTQLRLLLPDTSENAKATDATARPADLDCDKHAADDDDCDDLQARYHPGGADKCDGEDTNCAGDRLIVTDCPLQTAACAPSTTGVQLCTDTGTGSRVGTCFPDPACQCSIGNPGPCTKCILEYKSLSGTTRAPCAPAVGKLHLLGCTVQTPCTVEALPQAAWDARLAIAPDGSFAPRVTAVSDALFLRAKYLGNTLDAAPASSVGSVFLAVTMAGATRVVGVDLELAPDGIDDCGQGSGNGNFPMACSP